jgi:hypothetical protein
MFKAFQTVTKVFRPLQAQAIQPCYGPTITLRGFQNEENEGGYQQSERCQYQSNAYLRAGLMGFVMVVGKKIDDTVAHMLSWGGSSFEVASGDGSRTASRTGCTRTSTRRTTPSKTASPTRS